MMKVICRAMALAAIIVSMESHADSISHGGTTINMEFIEIGFPENMVDSNVYNNVYGSVGYNYHIGKYEVSADQWGVVIAADSRVGVDQGYWSVFGVSRPQAYISWYAAAKFCNWLASGDAYTGAYQFDAGGSLTNVLSRAEILSSGTAYYILPTEDEWYKAAYFKSDGSDYTWYAFGDSTPGVETDANYGGVGGSYSAPWDIGTGNAENNSTFDMNGNVYEWMESAYDGTLNILSENRTVRGGAYENDLADQFLHSKSRFEINPLGEDELIGFRVAHIPATSPVVPATIHYVNINGALPTYPYTNWLTAATNIQDAVDAAASSDTVLVTNGIYVLDSEILVTNNITVASVNGPEWTAVDGEGSVRCFNLANSACVIGGFTITNGYSSGSSGIPNEARGGGIYCEAGYISAIVSNCMVVGNSVTHLGGGMYYGTAINCLFTGNHADFAGGGKYGGVLENCTVVNNSATIDGGGLDGSAIYPGIVRNSIEFRNVAPGSPDNFQFVASCSPHLQHGVDGNITNAPLFVNEPVGNYHLLATSPCIDMGSNALASASIDLDGNPRIANGVVDMGVYEAPEIVDYSSVSFGTGVNQFDMEFVEVGYRGNAADSANLINGENPGAISYNYWIGKFEVTAAQYNAARAADPNIGNTGLNFGLYPVDRANWYEAAKFCNWLTSGDAYAGAYQFDGSGTLTNVNRNGAVSGYNPVYVLPDEDEWYKTAFFKSDGSGYTVYATGDSVPGAGTVANYLNGGGGPWPGGTKGIADNNGTFEMNGNLWEWIEGASDGMLDDLTENRSLTGGSFGSTVPDLQSSSHGVEGIDPLVESEHIGFRVTIVQAIGAVANVTAAQRMGTKLVDIYYDVSSDVSNLVSISVGVRAGTNQLIATSFTGDIGSGVSTGALRHIMWDGGADQNGLVGDLSYTVSAVLSAPGSTTALTDLRDYSLTIAADHGTPNPVVGTHSYAKHASVTASVGEVASDGWMFLGWTGDAVTGYSQTNVVVQMDQLSKSIEALFSDDADGDGLLNTNEWLAGTDPRDGDTDGDGFDDNFEVINGYVATNSDVVITDYIRNKGSTFGLYTTNVLLDVTVGQMAVEVSGGNADLWLQLMQSDDLIIWTNAGSAVYWSLPVDSDKQFFRVRAEP